MSASSVLVRFELWTQLLHEFQKIPRPYPSVDQFRRFVATVSIYPITAQFLNQCVSPVFTLCFETTPKLLSVQLQTARDVLVQDYDPTLDYVKHSLLFEVMDVFIPNSLPHDIHTWMTQQIKILTQLMQNKLEREKQCGQLVSHLQLPNISDSIRRPTWYELANKKRAYDVAHNEISLRMITLTGL